MDLIKRTILILCVLCSMTLLSQSKTTITGYIYDKATKKELPYVNIGFLKESVGTVTDDSGKFDLKFDRTKISNNSILQISFIGYKTVKLRASNFFAAITNDNKFYLEPEPFALDAVVLTKDLRKERGIGSLRINRKTLGYWLNPEALGGEIATKFPIDKENTRLHDLKFYVVRNNSGWIKVRVNVYEYKNGMPGKNLLSKNIYHTIKTNTGIETINLEPYHIIVNNDIVVSLELIKVYGYYIDFEISGSDYKTHSFIRQYNQDDWERFPGVGMAFKLRTSYPSPKGKIIPKQRTIPEKLVLYWDASLSMLDENRNTERELNLLEKYLKKLNNVRVKIIKFSALTLDQQELYVTNGDCDAIINYLLNTDYEGEASFSNLLKANDFKADAALLFSSAKTIFERLEQVVYLPTFSINSIPEANHSTLQTASLYGDGDYIDLSKISVKQGLEMMLTEYESDTSYEETAWDAGNIKGSIISDSLVIARASISIKNTLIETESDNKGHFSIDAKPGDVLVINAFGMFEKEVTLSSDTDVEINLTPDTTLLEEVTLYGSSKQKTVTAITPYGEKNVNAIGYSVNELTDKDISPGDMTWDDIIGKIPGVQISGIGDNKRYSFLINVMSSTGVFVDPNPIIVVDDIIYFQKDGLDHLPPIDMQSIKSVRAIKSLAGTNRYGSAAAYGAIEIRTQATSVDKTVNTKLKENTALVKGNDYIDEGIPLLGTVIDIPNSIKELNQATTFEEAKSIYQNQKASLPLTIPYILRVSEYFKKWNPDYAYIVLTNLAAIAGENAKALKTFAFKLEETQHFDTAKLIYERIAKLKPNDAQSYLDLANIYKETGDYDQAMELYKQMLANILEGIDFTGLQQILIDEMQHLVTLHRSQVNSKELPKELLTANFKQDSRIVFEWNDPNAGFELQFVNPQKKFYTWSHTQFDNKKRLLDEIKNGYTSIAYVIDDAEAGEWIINLKVLNQKPSLNPTYLKYTLYTNYGLANETKTVKVIPLLDIKEKVTLDRFLYK